MRRSRCGAALFCLALCARVSVAFVSCLVCFAVDCLATVLPHNNRSKQDVQSAKSRSHKPVVISRWTEDGDRAEEHETDTHCWNCSDRKHAAGDHARAIKQQPQAGNGTLNSRSL